MLLVNLPLGHNKKISFIIEVWEKSFQRIHAVHQDFMPIYKIF
jgi:hypothetical protein